MRRIPAVRRVLVLESGRPLSPSVRELVLRTEDRGAIDYLAGQWLKLYLPGGIDRDYSIANAPDRGRPDRIALAVTRVESGPGSAFLHAMRPGDRVDSLGPNGLFVREDRHRSQPGLYVGTGTGLAPLRAMIEEELARPLGSPQALLFGCRREEDLLWREDLERWACSPRFRLFVTLSRGSPAWAGLRGYVQAHVGALARMHPDAHIYVCGLNRMITEVRRVLREDVKLDRGQVHSERYD